MPWLTLSAAVTRASDLIVEVEFAVRSDLIRRAKRQNAPSAQSTTNFRTALVVDTGSTITTIDERIATQLNLPIRGTVAVATHNTKGLHVQTLKRAASMVMFDTANSRGGGVLVPGLLVAIKDAGTYLDLGIGGVLGMDVIGKGTLEFDGSKRTCTMRWPQSLYSATF